MIKEMSPQDLVDENNELREQLADYKKRMQTAEENADREHDRFEKLRQKYYKEMNYYEHKLNFYESRHPELQQEFDLHQRHRQDD